MSQQSDETLIAQARKGSSEAFSELVRRHQVMVYSLCYRLTGNVTEAEDLAQESFLRLYSTMGKFHADARLRPWLWKITTNVCLDAMRKRKGATISLDDLTEGLNQPQSVRRDELPEEAYLGRETSRDVQNALLRLPGDFRVVLVLRYLQDLSYQEIADVLGVPLTTVETRIFRAKKMLGQILALSGDEGEEGACHELSMDRRANLSLL